MNKLALIFSIALIGLLAACTAAQNHENTADNVMVDDSDTASDDDKMESDDTAMRDDAMDDEVTDETGMNDDSENAPPAANTQVIQVDIRGFDYSPRIIQAQVGDTVRFTNHDSAPHTATSVSGAHRFDSGVLRTGESWEYVVPNSGTTQGYCALHPSMEFTLDVE